MFVCYNTATDSDSEKAWEIIKSVGLNYVVSVWYRLPVYAHNKTEVCEVLFVWFLFKVVHWVWKVFPEAFCKVEWGI